MTFSSPKSSFSPSNSTINRWFIHQGEGPVMTTAVHAGHEIRPELHPYLAADDGERRREEDPLTDVLASLGDNVFSCYTSRFEVDLNRARHKACATDPKDTWGMKIWKSAPPPAMTQSSLEQHDEFYCMMDQWLKHLISRHGKVLLLDLHSYNHRRDGPDGPIAPVQDNPEIDLGLTTRDPQRFGQLSDKFSQVLSDTPCQGRRLDVRANVRYPDGGHWPEWVYANFGHQVCTITLEYKKFYMDEWKGEVSLPVVEDLRLGLSRAVQAAREELLKCQ